MDPPLLESDWLTGAKSGFGDTCPIRINKKTLRYHRPMKPIQETDEYTAFQSTLRRVLQVSKSELERRIAEDNASRADKPKRGPKPRSLASARVSSEKD